MLCYLTDLSGVSYRILQLINSSYLETDEKVSEKKYVGLLWNKKVQVFTQKVSVTWDP